MTKIPQVKVIGPKDEIPEDALKLSVSSRAPVLNPDGWRDLWPLSPFSVIPEGLPVPGLPGVMSKTVENAWQFLKVWPGEDQWLEDEARAAFQSDCAIRYPRGHRVRAVAHYWHETGEMLDYVTARMKIYLPLYLQLLELPDRLRLIERLRQEAQQRTVCIWDFDSYDAERFGIENEFDVIFNTERPFAHAFILAFVIRNQVSDFLEHIANRN